MLKKIVAIFRMLMSAKTENFWKKFFSQNTQGKKLGKLAKFQNHIGKT